MQGSRKETTCLKFQFGDEFEYLLKLHYNPYYRELLWLLMCLAWAYAFYWIGALMCWILLDSSHNVYGANVCKFYLSLQGWFKVDFLRGDWMFSDNEISRSLKLKKNKCLVS